MLDMPLPCCDTCYSIFVVLALRVSGTLATTVHHCMSVLSLVKWRSLKTMAEKRVADNALFA